MLLPFKRTLSTGEGSDFVAKIRNQEKIHTFRLGSRWRPGLDIHFWDESPRNVHANPAAREFSIPNTSAEHWEKNHKDQWLPKCVCVENFDMTFYTDQLLQEQINFLSIGGRPVTNVWNITEIAKNDGLTLKQFRHWFYTAALDVTKEGMKLQGMWKKGVKIMDQPQLPQLIQVSGQIIHWTDKVYYPEMAQRIEDKNDSQKGKSVTMQNNPTGNLPKIKG